MLRVGEEEEEDKKSVFGEQMGNPALQGTGAGTGPPGGMQKARSIMDR
jgi:hypothetical protein